MRAVVQRVRGARVGVEGRNFFRRSEEVQHVEQFTRGKVTAPGRQRPPTVCVPCRTWPRLRAGASLHTDRPDQRYRSRLWRA